MTNPHQTDLERSGGALTRLLTKNGPPLLAGYRKFLVAGVGLFLIGLISWQRPEHLTQVADAVVWIVGLFLGGNAVKGGAQAFAQRGSLVASSTPPSSLPGPDELTGDLPLGVYDGEMATGHPEE